jgi:hypothetical protein
MTVADQKAAEAMVTNRPLAPGAPTPPPNPPVVVDTDQFLGAPSIDPLFGGGIGYQGMDDPINAHHFPSIAGPSGQDYWDASRDLAYTQWPMFPT